jgi:hypothetical protein
MLLLSVVFSLSPKEKANFLAPTLLRSYVTPECNPACAARRCMTSLTSPFKENKECLANTNALLKAAGQIETLLDLAAHSRFET